LLLGSRADVKLTERRVDGNAVELAADDSTAGDVSVRQVREDSEYEFLR